jgi:6-phosphofructo-2-kinase / fructose-2,6-biphosphatase 4
MFIESICTDPEIIESNIHQTVIRAPEYKGMSNDEALTDFRRRHQHYMSIYESINEGEGVPFLKVQG